jgi:SAM-dependent methyltransferase
MESCVTMLRPNPAEQWERFGREDPYYGVYSIDEFRGRELDKGARDRFFASGEEHVEALLVQLRRHFGPEFSPQIVLDYGCGVGRMLIPLARRTERATGVDVAPSMLAEARTNLTAAGLPDVELKEAGDLEHLAPEFDLVHSAIVLQHMPVRDGEQIVAALAKLLRPGGVGAIHLPIAGRRSLRVFNALMKLPWASNALNLMRGRAWSYPHMQMNVYDLSRVAVILHARGVETIYVALAPPHGGYQTCTLYFRR